MSVYQPDMRVMRRISQTGVYVSHASYKTHKGAQALCEKLLKRKPKCSYHVRQTGDLYYVYAHYSI